MIVMEFEKRFTRVRGNIRAITEVKNAIIDVPVAEFSMRRWRGESLNSLGGKLYERFINGGG